MSWIGLRHKGVEVLFPDEWNRVVDALDILRYYTDQKIDETKLSSLDTDVAPAQDNSFDLGKPDKEWRDIYAHYGYFSDAVIVQGKPVLKDGDPISIYDIFDTARDKITSAIDNSIARSDLDAIRDKIDKMSIDEYGNVGVVFSEPIDIGDMSDTARDKISQAIDNTSTASNISGIKSKFDQVRLDSEGNVGVAISSPLDSQGRVLVSVDEIVAELKKLVKPVVSLFIENTLDADIDITIKGNIDQATSGSVAINGTITVPASSNDAVTLVPQNLGWLPYIYVEVTAKSTPSTGAVTIYLVRSKDDKQAIVDNLEIRDTNTHTPDTDPDKIIIAEW